MQQYLLEMISLFYYLIIEPHQLLTPHQKKNKNEITWSKNKKNKKRILNANQNELQANSC